MPLMAGLEDHSPSGRISAVSPGSLAQGVGLRPGDELLSINGHRLRDVIDVGYYASDPLLQLRVRRDGEALVFEAERRYLEPLGLEFSEPVFDRIRRCNNRCEFCFVAQMPRGLRPSLYVRDDDYRLSFLFGSYVTLTNLTEADWARIDEQHLSPLYVSVHATEPDLRRRLLRNPQASDVIAQLHRLADMDIEVHTQIVIWPGVNDGIHLDRSIGDLVELYPTVRSVSVVPLGLTRYHRLGCRIPTDAEMRDVLERVGGWQTQLRERLGVGFAYLSDEWYLRLGERVPPLEAYDGLDLAENGVGLVAAFEVESWRLRSAIRDLESATLVTGTLFAPVLRAAVAGSPGEVVSLVNRFFGESVTVAGLLTARDVIDQLEGRDLGEVLLLPPAVFAGPDGQSLDDMWPREVAQALGRPVLVGMAPQGEPTSIGGSVA
jgi:putative radical SAM enzyme (TIGR03279 family)